MNEKEQLIKNTSEIELLKLKVEALISILAKEGILTGKEVSDEVSSLLKEE